MILHERAVKFLIYTLPGVATGRRLRRSSSGAAVPRRGGGFAVFGHACLPLERDRAYGKYVRRRARPEPLASGAARHGPRRDRGHPRRSHGRGRGTRSRHLT